jgi:hypothetical protein
MADRTPNDLSKTGYSPVDYTVLLNQSADSAFPTHPSSPNWEQDEEKTSWNGEVIGTALSNF